MSRSEPETSCCTPAGSTRPPVRQGPGTVFRIPDMDCAVEESDIRRALDKVAGIRSLNFQLGARTVAIDAPSEVLPRAVEAIRGAGYEPRRLDGAQAACATAPDAHGHAHAHGDDHAHGPGDAHDAGTGVPRLALALVLALGSELLHFLYPDTPAAGYAGMALAALAIWLAGVETYAKGVRALLRGRLNINALMSVAVTGAFLIGQWPEAAMVMALYAIAELIEARAADRARNAIQGLVALAPEQATVLQPDGQWRALSSSDVALDAVVRLRPGERVPLDGVVTRGRGSVDQSPVTGESLPVERDVGDPVFAGTINLGAELQFRVTAAASDTTLARIVHAVEQAQGSRAPTQRFVDRFAAIYTPAVFVLALVVAVATPWLTGLGWTEAIYKALVLLVVACPCALVISTPVTVVSALAAAARRGILVKGGTYLEEARKLRAVAFDKTGTVTEGRPRLVEWQATGGDPDRARIAGVAAGLAGRSDHPVSRAIAQGLAGETWAGAGSGAEVDTGAGAGADAGVGAGAGAGAGADTSGVDGFTALPGLGIRAVVGGRTHLLGNHRLIAEAGHSTPAIQALLAGHEPRGRTVTLLADESGVLAWFAVADTIKESSRRAIAELKALGVVPVMLTGDNAATARTIAAQADIAESRGDLLPQDKLAAIEALQRRHGRVGMTGDGINDAPALARADIGFAMGGMGTDIAMEAADVVIMNDDLRRIPETIRLSRRTHAVLVQNIALALGIKAVFMVLALVGSATMWMAVFADMGATLLVVANGLRLLRGAGITGAQR